MLFMIAEACDIYLWFRVLWISPRQRIVTCRKWVLLWTVDETMAACPHASPAWPWPVLSRIAVARWRAVAELRCLFEITVNLSEVVKWIFPRSGQWNKHVGSLVCRDDFRKTKREVKRRVLSVVVNKDEVSLYHPPLTSFPSLSTHSTHARLHIQVCLCTVLRSGRENVFIPANGCVGRDTFWSQASESSWVMILSEPVTVLCQDPVWTGRKWPLQSAERLEVGDGMSQGKCTAYRPLLSLTLRRTLSNPSRLRTQLVSIPSLLSGNPAATFAVQVQATELLGYGLWYKCLIIEITGLDFYYIWYNSAHPSSNYAKEMVQFWITH